MLTPERICELLDLVPHTTEGGWFRETYRSRRQLPADPVSDAGGTRSLSTAIYYLLTPATCSRMHRLRSDEIFHFYLGDPVEMLHLFPDGSARIVRLGNDLERGERPQIAVPAGVWQGARVAPGGRAALLGTTVAPGFEYDDYEAGRRDELIAAHPACRDLIVALTP
jgi:predicted cupin superfamily sugar epimerase